MSLEYIKQSPRVPSKRPPLLVLLHGLGSNERDLFSFAPQLDPRYLIISVRAPLAYSFGGYAWFNIDLNGTMPQANVKQLEEARQQFSAFLDEIIEEFHPHSDHIYLAGFSQGAIMSYATALAEPNKLTGLLAMSGYILRETVPQTPITSDHRRLKILATHGEYDRVLPVFLGRNAADFMKENQFDYQYKEYPMAHEVNQACFADIKHWLDERVSDL